MDDFEQELRATFLEETTQILSEAEHCFLILESDPQNVETLEKIFRLAHNIKGSSRAVGFDSLAEFTHEFESFLIKCKSRTIPITPSTVSLLLKCNDHITQFIEALKSDPNASLSSNKLIEMLQNFQPDDLDLNEDSVAVDGDNSNISHPNFGGEADPKKKNNKDESIRVSLDRLETLLNFVGELVILQTVLKEQAAQPNAQLLRRTLHQMGKVTKEVQDLSMGLRMIPVRQTFQKMQRIVRDTASVLGKKAQLILEGEETEVDKTVLEALSDPLVHLIRNAVDHGIEPEKERMANGKKEVGQIRLRAYHQSGKLVIEISDDGAGIQAERIRKIALEKGILKSTDTRSDEEVIQLIFHPGFSTKHQATVFSGRGVGMDVVKTNIEAMQGRVQVETVVNKGSTIRLVLPLTLAIIDGVVIRCYQERFVIPLSHVSETVQPDLNQFQHVTGMGEILMLRGENIPVLRLAQALGYRQRYEPHEPPVSPIAIIIRAQQSYFAVLVDEIVGQFQVVIKKLGAEVQHIRGYSGSAILGDGKPALILELADIADFTVAEKGTTK
jgi:two-component system, chemotaxis family, sensor kinase CheA